MLIFSILIVLIYPILVLENKYLKNIKKNKKDSIINLFKINVFISIPMYIIISLISIHFIIYPITDISVNESQLNQLIIENNNLLEYGNQLNNEFGLFVEKVDKNTTSISVENQIIKIINYQQNVFNQYKKWNKINYQTYYEFDQYPNESLHKSLTQLSTEKIRLETKLGIHNISINKALKLENKIYFVGHGYLFDENKNKKLFLELTIIITNLFLGFIMIIISMWGTIIFYKTNKYEFKLNNKQTLVLITIGITPHIILEIIKNL